MTAGPRILRTDESEPAEPPNLSYISPDDLTSAEREFLEAQEDEAAERALKFTPKKK